MELLDQMSAMPLMWPKSRPDSSALMATGEVRMMALSPLPRVLVAARGRLPSLPAATQMMAFSPRRPRACVHVSWPSWGPMTLPSERFTTTGRPVDWA